MDPSFRRLLPRASLPLPPLLLLASLGCGGFLPELHNAQVTSSSSTTPAGKVRTTAVADGWRTVIDATASSTFTGLDLETGAEAPVPGNDWDLSFGRSFIHSNGGVDGTGGVAVAGLLNAAFASVTQAPDPATTTYFVDQPDGSDNNTEPDTIFENGKTPGGDGLWWYDYDGENHVLLARPIVYVVKSTAARFYKVQIESYYDPDVGTSAVYTIHWAQIAAP